MRQVDALEDAAVWQWSELSKTRATATAFQESAQDSIEKVVDNKELGGMSRDPRLYLYGPTNYSGQTVRWILLWFPLLAANGNWQYHALCDILGGHDAIALVRPNNFMVLGWIE